MVIYQLFYGFTIICDRDDWITFRWRIIILSGERFSKVVYDPKDHFVKLNFTGITRFARDPGLGETKYKKAIPFGNYGF